MGNKLTVGLGMTLKIGGGYEMAKPSMELELDLGQDIDDQIEKAVTATVKVWDAQTTLMIEKIAELSEEPMEAMKGQIYTRLHNIETDIKNILEKEAHAGDKPTGK